MTIWAKDKAFEVGIPNLKTSSYFILDFKNECKITSRRITHLVTKRNVLPEISLQPIIEEFRDNFLKKWLISAFPNYKHGSNWLQL